MLNYFERIESYKKQLFFQINKEFLDFYVPKISLWSQDLLVAKDILKYASENKISDSYGVLNIRCFAGNISKEEERKVSDILSTANNQLASELGENDITKGLGLNPRHFSAIVWNQLISKKKQTNQVVDVLPYNAEDEKVVEEEKVVEHETEFGTIKRKRNKSSESILDQ